MYLRVLNCSFGLSFNNISALSRHFSDAKKFALQLIFPAQFPHSADETYTWACVVILWHRRRIVRWEFQVVFTDSETRDACAVSLISTKTAIASLIRLECASGLMNINDLFTVLSIPMVNTSYRANDLLRMIFVNFFRYEINFAVKCL